jgi:FkbM family methyltransferase
MFLDNLLPQFFGVIGSPICFIKRILYPEMVSFGLLANLAKMKSKGVIRDIDSIWDIGANRGQFAFMANSIWPNLPIYSFEPEKTSYECLVKNFKKYSFIGKTYNCAISNDTQSKQFYRFQNDVNNSLLENSSYKEGFIDSELVSCNTLDSIFSDVKDVNSAFLKLDVQGFELSVLAGATNFLEKCLYVLVEVSFSPTYAGGAHAGEVITVMRENGFQCINILDVLRDPAAPNKIMEADLLFENISQVCNEN